MIDRRRFIRAAGAGIATVALITEAQQAARLPRIGILLAGNAGTGTESLRQGFRDLCYDEGRNAVFEWRWWEGKPERLRDAAAEIVRLNPDVIVVGGSEATKAMKEATRTIPIVFSGPSYPVEEGLIETFARPGGNIAGILREPADDGIAQEKAARKRLFRKRLGPVQEWTLFLMVRPRPTSRPVANRSRVAGSGAGAAPVLKPVTSP